MPLQTAAKEENAGKNCRIQKGNAFSMNNTINASTPYTMCIQGKHSASVKKPANVSKQFQSNTFHSSPHLNRTGSDPTTGSLTVSTSRMMLVPPRKFSRILISRLIFFFLTG